MARFLRSHAIAVAGDAFVAVSLAGSLFFNVSANASRSQVLLYLAITMAPFALLAPFVGPAIDRFHAGPGLAAVLWVLRAGCSVGLALQLDELGFYVFALALLSASRASSVVKQAIVPKLVSHPSRLLPANSLLAQVSTLTGAAAGAAAAGLTPLIGSSSLLLVAAALFVIAAAVVLGVHLGAEDDAPAAVVFAELHQPSIVFAAAGLMVLRGGVGFYVFMLAFTLRRTSEPPWIYGVGMLAYGAGIYLGNLASPRLRRRWHEESLMAGALAGAAVVAVAGVLGVGVASLVVIGLGLGAAAAVGRQSFDSVVQRSAPDAVRGRTFARYETQTQLAWVAGAIVATAIRLPIEVSMVLLAMLFVPAVALFVRATREALRYLPPSRGGPLAAARARVDVAVAWHLEGSSRHAVLEAASAADLAVVAGATPACGPARRLDQLRQQALRGECIDDEVVAEALRLAREAVGITGPA